MSRKVLIVGGKGKGKTTKLHETINQIKREAGLKPEETGVFLGSALGTATKAQTQKLKLVAVDDVTKSEEVDIVLQFALSNPKKDVVFTIPSDVYAEMKAKHPSDFEGYKVETVAVVLP